MLPFANVHIFDKFMTFWHNSLTNYMNDYLLAQEMTVNCFYRPDFTEPLRK